MFIHINDIIEIICLKYFRGCGQIKKRIFLDVYNCSDVFFFFNKSINSIKNIFNVQSFLCKNNFPKLSSTTIFYL